MNRKALNQLIKEELIKVLKENKSKESEIEKLEKEIKDLEKEFNALSPKQKDKKWTPEALKLMKAQRETRVKINKLKRQIKTESEGSGYVKRHGENKGKPIKKQQNEKIRTKKTY